MAQKIFKGFMQVTEGAFEAQTGYIYFVRNSANTGMTDGYLQFNGKKYGTAAEVAAELNGKIGTIPAGYDNLVDYIDSQISAITFSDEAKSGASHGVEVVVGQADGNVTAVTVTAPDFENTYAAKSAYEAFTAGTEENFTAVDGRLDALEAISGDTHTHANKAVLDGITSEKVTSWDDAATSAHSHDNKTVLDGITAEKVASWDGVAGSADTRIAALESVSAGTRLTALEQVNADARLDALEDSAHTHANKTVLDGIESTDVEKWDSAIQTVKVNGSALTVTDNAVDVIIPAAAEYTIEAAQTPETGFFATYKLMKDGVQEGASINIPKDYLVKEASIRVCETADVPIAGLRPGDKYMDFVVNTLDSSGTESHMYINIADLAHVYTQGDGIEISASDEISAKVVEANGLSVDANGIAMALADASNNGAMSSTDFVKLSTIDASAQTNVIETVKVNGTALTVTDKAVDVVLPSATKSGISNDVKVEVVQTDGAITAVNVTAPEMASQDDIEALSGRVQEIEEEYTTTAKTAQVESALGTLSGRVDAVEEEIDDMKDAYLSAVTFDNYTAATDTRLDNLEASAETFATTAVTEALDTRVDALEESAHTHGNKSVLDGITAEKVANWDTAAASAATKAEFDAYTAATDTRLDNLEASAETFATTAMTDSAWTRIEAVATSADSRLDTLEAVSADTRITALENAASGYATTAMTDSAWTEITQVSTSANTRLNALESASADTRLDELELAAISADTRLDALEALTASTDSALQSISAGDASVNVGTKDANKDQTVAVAISSASGNTIALNNDGLFAAIYYDGDDSN